MFFSQAGSSSISFFSVSPLSCSGAEVEYHFLYFEISSLRSLLAKSSLSYLSPFFVWG